MNREVHPFIGARIEKMRLIMAEKNIDTVIISSPENVFYFSNFNPIIFSHPAFVILTKKADPYLLVHCIRHDHARDEGAIEDIKLFGKWGDHVSVGMDPVEAIKSLTGGESNCVGVEGDYISMNMLEKLKGALPIRRLADISHDIKMLKIIKDAYEIARIRQAAELVDAGLEKAIEELANGNSEAGACTEGQYRMRKLWQEKYSQYEVAGFGSSEGAQIDSLVLWSMANGRIAYGCDCPKNYVPVPGDLVLPMSWARIGGYAAEIERAVIVGEVEAIRTRAYDAMLAARQAVLTILRPGVLFEELYKAAMQQFEDAGFGSILPGRCGHGIGLSTHEFPSLTTGNKIALQPGMIFTVEPGLMTNTLGGVRHSDTVLVTEKGYELLTKLRNDKITIKK
jgi:Xaa-Pro aminopeptidase